MTLKQVLRKMTKNERSLYNKSTYYKTIAKKSPDYLLQVLRGPYFKASGDRETR